MFVDKNVGITFCVLIAFVVIWPRRELSEWEQIMLAHGRTDLVRKPFQGRIANKSDRQLYRELGITEPPKRPANRYIQFRLEQLVRGVADNNIPKLWRNLTVNQRQEYDRGVAELKASGMLEVFP